MKKLIIDITGHGYGHVGQLAPILNRLHLAHDNISFCIRSHVPEDQLREMITVPFEISAPAPDVGMVMHSPYQVDSITSLADYRKLHTRWHEVVQREAEQLLQLNAYALISDVGYCALAAAQKIGLPNGAISSLNWFDIFCAYCDAPDIIAQIKNSYQKADFFLKLEPALPMDWLENTHETGPSGRRAKPLRQAIHQALNLSANTRLLLYCLGGINDPERILSLPKVPDSFWIISGKNIPAPNRTDWRHVDDLPFGFIDILGNCDAVITKPGYGIFVEACLNSTRILSCLRPDWPENIPLTQWAEAHGHIAIISRKQLEQGSYQPELEELLKRSARKPAQDGIDQAVTFLTAWLAKS